MKTTLRDNPILTDQGVSSWPPAWLRTSGNESTIATGEAGILLDVKTHDAMSSKCFLFMEHNGATFVGRMSVDSTALCQKLVTLLKQHRGEPLRQIGELDLDLADIQEALCSAA
jgi:hypothetical protein